MDKNKIRDLLTELGRRLLAEDVLGEIGIVGGAAMLLAFDSRKATRDIDAIFKPSTTIRSCAKQMAFDYNLSDDWLNDGVKGFLPGNPKNRSEVLILPGIKVWVPEPEYLLAMKVISARVDTSDGDDIKFLINHLHLKNPAQVFEIVCGYYSENEIPAKARFFIEELFEI